MTKKTENKPARTDRGGKLVLLDVHAILHRAYHALPDFATSAGVPTGGLYGLSTMLMRIIKDLKPDYLAACYDRPEPTFRKAVYDEYKAGRKAADEALIAQIIRSREIFDGFGIPIYDMPGFEADDIIGTVAEVAKKEKNLTIIIASGDHDTLQLVDDKKVMVYTLRKGLSDVILYDEEKVKERYGFAPKLLPDYKGLAGDQSDNIIGIKGIGEKSASLLVGQFGTLENIYQKLKKVKKEFLAAGVKERVLKLLEEGEEEALFSKTLATIRRDVPIKFALPERSWREGFNPEPLRALFAALEFRSLKDRVGELMEDPVRDREGTQRASVSNGVDPQILAEARILAWLLNSEITNPTTEDVLTHARSGSVKEAHPVLLGEVEHAGLEKVFKEIEQPLIPILNQARERGIVLDKKYLAKLGVEYHQELTALENKIYEQVGEKFNLNSPKQLGEILFDKLALPMKGLKKTAGGARSTRESELLKLQDEYPVVKDILAYRELQKLLSTYIDSLPRLADSEDALHSTLEQTGAATGRMSSRDPNLQNIPADSGRGKAIRQAFLARPGHLLLALDYSQIEMRVLAVLSGDKDLLEIFHTGGDIHTGVASRVFSVPEKEVTKDMRRKAKVINFGIIYGMGVNALKANLGSTRQEASDFYDRYFATFPTINTYFDEVKLQAKKRGYTETYFGRRRYLPGLSSPIPFIRAAAERAAMNAPIQGTAADIIKLAMIKVDERLKKENLLAQAHLLLQVHDELLYEVEEGIVEKVLPIIKAGMENVMTSLPESAGGGWPIPLVTSSATGHTWGEL